LPPELTAKTANFRRFEREAQLCSQLDHPTSARFTISPGQRRFLYCNAVCQGKNVRQLVDGRPLELKSALSIITQVCDALATRIRAESSTAISSRKHNGYRYGQVKILDFGLAKLYRMNR
jgi:serine/threonine-protein kinase